MGDFETFWAAYPRRVGKLAAMKEYAKALTIATPEEILAGVEAYKKHKPEYADWCHPRTFLAQGRWMDDYTPPKIEKKRNAPALWVPMAQRYKEGA